MKKPKKKIFLSGHKGMVGSALLKYLSLQKESKNYEIITRTRKQLNLIDQKKVENFLKKEKPDEVIIASAKVGGINANNSNPVDLLYENLMIETNLINFSFHSGVKSLIFLGSSCIYPKEASQPIKEEFLLSGPLEKTNEAYAIAKIAGIKLCNSFNKQFNVDFRCIMPCNLYGPGDNYDLEESHVIPALIRKFHLAKSDNKKFVKVWGTGKPKREFLHVYDLADACMKIRKLSKKKFKEIISPEGLINVGSGKEISISELAQTISNVVGFNGDIVFDKSMPDGTMRKVLDISKINKTNWQPKYSLKEGIIQTYSEFLKNTNKRL